MDELKNIEPFRSSYPYTDVCQGRPHSDACLKVVLTLPCVSRSSSLYRVCQGRPRSSACFNAVLTLAHKLLMLMHRLAICLLLYLCLRL